MTIERRDYLLEIGVEEMPARFMNPALSQLKELAVTQLSEKRLSFVEAAAYGTPRRLVLFVKGVAGQQDPLEVEVKGPAAKVAYKPDGTPTRAAEGFAKSQGVTVEDLVVKPVGHVDYVFAVKREEGRPAKEVLAKIAPSVISGLHFPKPMRWGSLEVRFARPIRWLVSLWGDEVVEFEYAGLTAGRTTYGHRFLCKEPLIVANPAEYFEKMKSNYVMVDPQERKESIWRQVVQTAAAAGGKVEEDEELLEEVNNLVEYPTALLGSFDPAYLKLPREVLVTPMREHQRYFPVVGNDGRLLPVFVAVVNGTDKNHDIIRAGNEKVLKARLSDASFFFNEDTKTPLASKVPALRNIVFQEGLGTLYDKTERLVALAEWLAGVLGVAEQEKEDVLRAAHLAKADLVTNMVYEFPELQGVMGREYAVRSGERGGVAQAIFEHYLPRFAGDMLPSTLPGSILSLADKMDNIVGCFAMGIQPTGSQDPYALRRQASGMINIIINQQLTLSFNALMETAYRGYEARYPLKHSLEETKGAIVEFFAQRLRGIFMEEGFSYDVVDAVLASGCDDFTDTRSRVKALFDLRRQPVFGALLTAFTRANNLAKNAVSQNVDESLLEEPAEKELYACLCSVLKTAGDYLEKRDYSSFLSSVAGLCEPLDRFFNSVMVMVEDKKIRENRLALLLQLASAVRRVADLSKIVGE